LSLFHGEVNILSGARDRLLSGGTLLLLGVGKFLMLSQRSAQTVISRGSARGRFPINHLDFPEGATSAYEGYFCRIDPGRRMTNYDADS